VLADQEGRPEELGERGHDVVLGNLEGPIDETHTQTPDSSLLFSFSPAVASILAQQGFSVLSLANNHGLDQGTDGVQNSRAALRAAGIDPLGHPQQITKDDVVIKTFGEEAVAMIGFHATQPNFSLEKATTLIKEVRRDHPNAFIVIFPHWGTEYQAFSNKTQKAFARACIDAGADAIFGHHPHVVQEAEVYANRLIVYSLGNFIFDQYFSEETQQELAIRATITGSTVTYRFVPLRSEKSQPQLMDTEETKTWLHAYAERSNILDLADGALELTRSMGNS